MSRNGRDIAYNWAAAAIVLASFLLCILSPKRPTETPKDFYHDVWQIVDENYLFRDRLNEVGWKGLEHEYDGEIQTFEDAEQRVHKILSLLNDPYTGLHSASESRTLGLERGRSGVVKHKMLDATTGYIHLAAFSAKAAPELAAALRALKEEGAKELRLDLRGNHGGLVSQAFACYELLVDEGEFATITAYNRGTQYYRQYWVKRDELLEIERGKTFPSKRVSNLTGNCPLTVYVDEETASAAEMLAGALQASGRAKLVGSQTYGKGISQTEIHLRRGGSLTMTCGKICQPGGRCIHGLGLTPDDRFNNVIIATAK